MAVTAFQSEILRLIARRRIEKGETYVAGGLALNHQLGKAVLNSDGTLFFGNNAELAAALKAGSLAFHEGSIGGAWPRILA